jgi:hypothetical protein
MVVAVIAVAMMQATVNQIIDVIAMRNGRVAAAVVITHARDRPARCRVLVANCDDMLVIMSIVRVVQMPVVQIIDVPVMQNARVAAVLTMRVCVIVMGVVAHHSLLFSIN